MGYGGLFTSTAYSFASYPSVAQYLCPLFRYDGRATCHRRIIFEQGAAFTLLLSTSVSDGKQQARHSVSFCIFLVWATRCSATCLSKSDAYFMSDCLPFSPLLRLPADNKSVGCFWDVSSNLLPKRAPDCDWTESLMTPEVGEKVPCPILDPREKNSWPINEFHIAGTKNGFHIRGTSKFNERPRVRILAGE